MVFGSSVLLSLGGFTRAHCHTVLAQQLRVSFSLGSLAETSVDVQRVREDLRNRTGAVLGRWPLLVEIGELSISMGKVHGRDAAQASAEFIPLGGLIPGFRFTEKVVVFVESV